MDAESRAHFISIAGRAMRQVRVDRARARGTQKRGGDWAVTTLGDGDATVEVDPADMLALDQAIRELDPGATPSRSGARPPRGGRLEFVPEEVRAVPRSVALLDGRHLGAQVLLGRPPALGGLRMPRRGVFLAGTERLRAGCSPLPPRS